MDRSIRRRISLLWLTAALLAGSLSPAAAAEAPAGAEVYSHDGRVTLIDGALTQEPVKSSEDAAAVVDAVLSDLGGDEGTRLEPWRTITDAFGNQYYVFQQMHDNTTVLGGAVKVAVSPEGEMLGLTASLVESPSEPETAEVIDAGKAEELVLAHAENIGQPGLTIVEGRTEQVILPLTLEVDIEAEEEEGSRYVWVVYTDNPDASLNRSSDLPYLAHYVTLGGEYLYSLPTIMPGDEAGESGFDSSYVFEFMEPADYTGYVDLSTGEEMEISVSVMRDKRTGMYYLGNIERRIVVADCWEFLYNGNRVVLSSSPDNMAWDQTGLLTLYNYCRAYDYYKEIGWIGGDGLGTPILVLNDYCGSDHSQINNAAYAGKYLGWQVFLASQANDFAQSLDVLAHEFTHCVTGTVMTYNAYMNDFGAINEAMSDIQGKTCEMMMDGEENVTWTMGDHSLTSIRSMDAPHFFRQPEYTWDLFYTPNVKTPTSLNDRGGVHSNSSLLNYLAYLLYEEGGMSLEEGRAFWFTVDCAMVPGTDYPQLAEILPWALKLSGLSQYEEILGQAIDRTRLGASEVPESFEEGQALLTLNLPEKELFRDEQWIMMVYSLNVDRLVEDVTAILANLEAGDYSDLPALFQDMLKEQDARREEREKKAAEEGEQSFLSALMDALLASTQEPEEETPDLWPQMKEELSQWLKAQLMDVYYSSSTNTGQDGQTMRMMGIEGYALPILMHGVVDEFNNTLKDCGFLFCLGGRWMALDTGLLGEAGEEAEVLEKTSDVTQYLMDLLVENILQIHSLDDVLKLLFVPVEGGRENILPTDGLEELEVMLVTMPVNPPYTEAEPRMSRPKLEEPEEPEETKELEEAEEPEEAA